MNIKKGWWRLIAEISKNNEDLVIWKLNQLCIQSYAFNYTEKDQDKSKLIIWLPEFHWEKNDRDELENELNSLFLNNDCDAVFFGWALINEQDWQNSWKKFWNLELIGKNLIVLPSWMDLPTNFNKNVVVKIDPGLAFGTGSHPSTSLCLEMMEKTIIKKSKILDVGCGSGILSVTAKKLGAKEIYVIDNDNMAINATKNNFLLNFGNLNTIKFYEGCFLQIKSEKILNNYDLILCNIIASVIRPFVTHFYEILNVNGCIILSGILFSQKDEIIKLLNLYHFRIDNVISKKDWICIKACK